MTTLHPGTFTGRTTAIQVPDDAAALMGPTICRHRLGAELRKLRESLGYRLEDIAARLDVAPSTLSRIETGKAPARTSYVQVMLDSYGLDDAGQRSYLEDLAREGQRKGWWADHDDILPHGAGEYVGLEAAARKVLTFAVQTIPSLLQTPGYAEAVIRATRPDLTSDQVQALVMVTLRRQELARGHRKLHAVIDESALLRSLGSPAVMTAQLDHLTTAAADPLTTVQVLCLKTPQHVISPGFTILGFTDHAYTDVGSHSGDDGHITITTDHDTVQRLQRTFLTLARQAAPAPRTAELIHELRKQHDRQPATEQQQPVP
jgi:transcriptional regulator with XRE-family HTH domain